MTGCDRHGRSGGHWRETRACCLAASALLWACAGPAAQPSAKSPAQPAARQPAGAPASAPGDANLESRLREMQQAEALYLSGRLKEAQAAFEALARTYPGNAEVRFRLGNTLMRQGKYDEAAAALQDAMALDPGNGRAALNLTLARLAQAQSAVAIARGRLASGTPEQQQADAIERRLKSLLSDSPGGESSR